MKFVASVFSGLAAALSVTASAADKAESPVVVELFTSQSCSSCVAAADYFEDLAARDDIVALGWHVDYWNALQTRNGRWADPYSDAAHTDRQRHYNRNLRATGGVYTPQIVVNGASEAVGSARSDVEALISVEKENPPSAQIASMVRKTDGEIAFALTGEGEVVVVYFMPTSQTAVRGGENAGRQFNDINIVTDVAMLGAISDKNTFSAPAPIRGENCALLVQAPGQGRILAAQYCPGI